MAVKQGRHAATIFSLQRSQATPGMTTTPAQLPSKPRVELTRDEQRPAWAGMGESSRRKGETGFDEGPQRRRVGLSSSYVTRRWAGILQRATSVWETKLHNVGAEWSNARPRTDHRTLLEYRATD